jgi:ribosomal protein S18 acetylase RimI-like enzyme
MSNPDAVIRLYRPVDREDVLRIGADTAFFGAPIEKYMEDRRIFCDIFYSYYTDVEPGYCWIAEVEGRVAGFLAGCPDSKAKAGLYLRSILPGSLGSLIRGKYQSGPLTRDYLHRLVGAGFRNEAPHVDFKIYPAHLHINVDAGFRGHGFGRRLMNAYLGQLRGGQITGVHLNTTSLNEAACRLYESVGFRLLDARPTRMWEGIVEGHVENRCYGLQLRNGQTSN